MAAHATPLRPSRGAGDGAAGRQHDAQDGDGGDAHGDGDDDRRPREPLGRDGHRAGREHRHNARRDAPFVADDEVPPEPAEAADEPHQRAASAATAGVAARRSSAIDRYVSRHHAASTDSSARSPPGHSSGSRSAAKTPRPSAAQKVPNVREQEADGELDGVLRHPRQRAVRHDADGQHQQTAAADRPGDRERDRVGVQAERDDDEDDLEALEEDALERDVKANQSRPSRWSAPASRAARCSVEEDLLLVVERLQSRRRAGSPCAATGGRRSAAACR